MQTRRPDLPTTLQLTSQRTAELDRLGDEIAELSAHLDAATARLLDLIREFDARGGWNTGFPSCAAWLAWLVGLAPGAARERVRVARALGTLPARAALASGELSYAKVRALTRVATPETEARLLAVGRAGTAVHVERIVRGWRRVDRQAEAREAARQQLAGRCTSTRMRTGPWCSAGGWRRRWARCSCERSTRPARCCTNRAAPAKPSGRPPTRPRRPRPGRSSRRTRWRCWPRRHCIRDSTPGAPRERYQSGGPCGRRGPGGSGATRPTRAGRGEPRSRGNVAAAGVRCEPGGDAARGGGAGGGGRSPDADDSAGAAAGSAASGPELPLPGCNVHVGQGHHVRHWAQGGPTTLSNLALLCRRHHRAVHEEGYQVARGPDETLQFRRPDGLLLPEVPVPAAMPADPVGALRARHAAEGLRLHARTGRPGWLGERLDVGWAIDVLHPLATRAVR